LHNPEYCQKYEINLKREFPCLPFYENFQKWVNWCKRLMDLHINYETIKPYNLQRRDISDTSKLKTQAKPKLKSDRKNL
jgi:predicted helicase